MRATVNTYKRQYDRDLKHVKLILMQERRRLAVREWLDLVQRTKDCILDDPTGFFGDTLPGETLFRKAIDKVFEGFLEDQRLVANQTGKGFRIPESLRTKH